MVGILLTATATPAFATTLYGAWGTYGPILGIPYANQADVGNNTIMQSGFAVKSTNGATIPGGWQGPGKVVL